MKQYYIYETTNNINNKKYIGKHYGEINDSYLGSGILIKKAIKKYGSNNFTKKILFISKDEQENCEKEKYYIQYYNAIQSEQYYNIASGGQGGYVLAGRTPEEKKKVYQKISDSLKGANNFNFGRIYSEKEKENLRKKSLEYWTEERRKQRSIQYSGEGNPMYGKKKSLESIKKQIEHTDYSFTQTEEYRKKMSMATSGTKNGNYGNIGEKAKNGKKIIMKDEYGNIIKEFNTVRLALEYLQIKGHSSLDAAIAKKRIYKGYYWEKQ